MVALGTVPGRVTDVEMLPVCLGSGAEIRVWQPNFTSHVKPDIRLERNLTGELLHRVSRGLMFPMRYTAPIKLRCRLCTSPYAWSVRAVRCLGSIRRLSGTESAASPLRGVLAY